MVDKRFLLGISASMGAVLLWSVAYIWKEQLMEHTSPMQLVFLQNLITVPMMGILVLLRRERIMLSPVAIGKIFLSGSMGLAVFQIATNVGISLVGSVVAAIFSGFLPTCSLVVEAAVFPGAHRSTDFAGLWCRRGNKRAN